MTGQMKVVRVLNARELAVSGGSAAGIEVNDVLRVLSDAIPLRDPDTNESLGELVSTKAVLKVYEVRERFALARTFRTKSVKISGGGAFAGALGGSTNPFTPPKYETRTETLLRDDTFDIDSEIAVEVGDIVEKYEGAISDLPSVTTWR